MEPRTKASRSRENAMRSGIFARILLRENFLGESTPSYKAMVSTLREAIKPVDGFEDSLVAKLALLHLRLARFYAADWVVAPELFEGVKQVLKGEFPAIETAWVDRKDHALVVRSGPAPELLDRYESGIERQIARTIDELERWRRMRKTE